MAQQWARERDETIRTKLAGMQELVRKLPAGLQPLEPLVAEGEPAEQILAAIDREFPPPTRKRPLAML